MPGKYHDNPKVSFEQRMHVQKAVVDAAWSNIAAANRCLRILLSTSRITFEDYQYPVSECTGAKLEISRALARLDDPQTGTVGQPCQFTWMQVQETRPALMESHVDRRASADALDVTEVAEYPTRGDRDALKSQPQMMCWTLGPHS